MRCRYGDGVLSHSARWHLSLVAWMLLRLVLKAQLDHFALISNYGGSLIRKCLVYAIFMTSRLIELVTVVFHKMLFTDLFSQHLQVVDAIFLGPFRRHSNASILSITSQKVHMPTEQAFIPDFVRLSWSIDRCNLRLTFGLDHDVFCFTEWLISRISSLNFGADQVLLASVEFDFRRANHLGARLIFHDNCWVIFCDSKLLLELLDNISYLVCFWHLYSSLWLRFLIL